MLRGTAGLRIAVKELTVLRDEAERRVRDNPTPALQRQARIDLENIERTLTIATLAFAQAEMFRHVEVRFDLACDVTVYDVALT